MIITKKDSKIRTVEQWFALAPPKGGSEQWVPGRSAFECARAWCPDGGGPCIPPELLALLSSRAETQNVTITSATPEHRVPFDDLRGEPRNADVAAVGDDANGRLAINIEAKADEPFDQYVCDVLLSAARRIAADEPTNSVKRIQNLAHSILPPRVNAACSLGELRYQLLTGIARAIAFAAEVGANRAAFLVHEFITDRTDDEKHRMNGQDLDNFVLRLSRRFGSFRALWGIIGSVSDSWSSSVQKCAAAFPGKSS